MKPWICLLALAAACSHPQKKLSRVDHHKMIVPGPGGGFLRVDDGGRGAGAAVVLVHGLGGSLELWDQQLEHLRGTRRAVAFDLRGHGQSAAADRPDDYSMEAMASDILAVADRLQLGRVVLVAHSLGGSVAEAFAAAHPDRVAGLLLVDASGDLRKAPSEMTAALLQTLRGPQWLTYTEQYAKQVCGQSDEVVARVVASAREAQQPALVAWFDGALRFDPVAALAKFAGPKLLVHSEFNDTAYSLVTLAPELPKQLIAAGHCLFLQEPAQFDAALDAFLGKVDAIEKAQPAAAARPGA